MAMLGVIAQKNGDLPEAVQQYQRASALQHSDVEELLLAQALRQEGRLDEANAIFKRVARTSPNLAAAEKTAAALLAGK
jgi:tetratricopeptide (TPR) repeat protein